jgi:hypothetical protein
MEQVGSLKRYILLLAHVHLRSVLYGRTGFMGIYCHMLNSNKLVQFRNMPTVEPSKKIQNASRPQHVELKEP